MLSTEDQKEMLRGKTLRQALKILAIWNGSIIVVRDTLKTLNKLYRPITRNIVYNRLLEDSEFKYIDKGVYLYLSSLKELSDEKWYTIYVPKSIIKLLAGYLDDVTVSIDNLSSSEHEGILILYQQLMAKYNTDITNDVILESPEEKI